MKSISLLFFLKCVSFVGAGFNTVGFLNFFFFPALDPYRWHLILGGWLLILLAETAAYYLAKKMAAAVED